VSNQPYLPTQNVPFSQEAEEAVIGSVLVNPGMFATVAAFLKPDDFFLLRNNYIWEALLRLMERDEQIDYLTLIEELRAMNRLDGVGGEVYVIGLFRNTPTSVHAEAYGRLVERAAMRRRLMAAADEIRGLALNENMAIEEVVTSAESRLFNVTERQLKREMLPLREAIRQYYDHVEYILQNPNDAVGVPSGFKDLDHLLGGFQKSDFIIFAGRPGMGKTSFLLSVVLNAAYKGARTAIYTMEMGAEQIVQRIISMETGINMQKLRLGQMDAREWERFVEAIGRLGNLNIFIDDTPAMNPIQLRTKTRRLQHEYGLDLVILDYLQLMNSGSGYENNRVQEISYISRSLKELAKEMNVPILSAAQLSRAVEQRHDKRPILSDLRESGCLAGESLVYLPDTGQYVPIRDLCGKTGFRVMSLNTETWKLEPAVVSNSWCTGVKPVYKMTTQLGRTIRATGNHKFLTIDGWKRLDELTPDDAIAVPELSGSHSLWLKPTGYDFEDSRSPLKGLVLANPHIAEAQMISSPFSGLGTSAAGHFSVWRQQPDSQILWDKIVSIIPDGETEVYDLTVPNNHNFVSENIIAHNSLEQDTDLVMFLYRDIVYNEATEFPNQADIIVAKHRNGPTGTISLYFEKSITKFMDAAVRNIDLSEL
jgi:replicative DNA helicase